MIRRVDVLVSGKGYTCGQPLNWSATKRQRKVPRSAKINSNGRDAGLCGRRGSDGLEGRRSEQDGRDLTAMTISLSIEGQYTDWRARWRIFVAPWCIRRSRRRISGRKDAGMTTRGPTRMMSLSTESWLRTCQNGRSSRGRFHLSFGKPLEWCDGEKSLQDRRQTL
jgi:hypothetical protein